MTAQTLFKRTFHIIGLLPLLLLTVLTVACDGVSRPQVIATYPQPEEAAGDAVVESARVELAVADAAAAARQVAQLVKAHGGYVLDSQEWYWQGRAQASVTAQVPARDSASFHRALLRLGTVLSERVTEVVDGHPGTYAEVTVILRSSAEAPAPGTATGWQPADTFRAAFAVFLGLFQALVDGLIWVLVVAGPFALMALGLATLIRRLRRGRNGATESSGSGEAP